MLRASVALAIAGLSCTWGAVIEVTAGGAQHNVPPTFRFSDLQGSHLANLSADSEGTVQASGDLVAGNGASLENLASQLAAALEVIELQRAQIQSLNATIHHFVGSTLSFDFEDGTNQGFVGPSGCGVAQGTGYGASNGLMTYADPHWPLGVDGNPLSTDGAGGGGWVKCEISATANAFVLTSSSALSFRAAERYLVDVVACGSGGSTVLYSFTGSPVGSTSSCAYPCFEHVSVDISGFGSTNHPGFNSTNPVYLVIKDPWSTQDPAWPGGASYSRVDNIAVKNVQAHGACNA
jgi:hypothetical protein